MPTLHNLGFNSAMCGVQVAPKVVPDSTGRSCQPISLNELLHSQSADTMASYGHAIACSNRRLPETPSLRELHAGAAANELYVKFNFYNEPDRMVPGSAVSNLYHSQTPLHSNRGSEFLNEVSNEANLNERGNTTLVMIGGPGCSTQVRPTWCSDNQCRIS